MPSVLTKAQKVQALAGSDLRRACDLARKIVAQNPSDEAAALVLRDLVQQFALSDPRVAMQPPQVPEVVTMARELIAAGKLEDAEMEVREYLKLEPRSAPAMHLMAEIAISCGLRADCERILHHSARIHADDREALFQLASTFHRVAVHEDIPEFIYKAAQVLDRALHIDPGYEPALALKAQMMMQTRGLDQAEVAYRKLVDLNPQAGSYWHGYGYLLKTVGEAGNALAAVRTALALEPANGSWWWTLVDLKNVELFESDIAAMEAVAERDDLPDDQRVPLHFALAKALDSARQFERAIGHVERGSEVRANMEREKPKPLIADSRFIRDTFTRRFFEERTGWGDPHRGPIFIVGMHRAGSTLVEQILSSHSQIEGTEELFIIRKFASELVGADSDSDHAATIEALEDEDFKEFGKRYLEISSRSRRTARPYLTDKYPGNWMFVGLIHCMLPNAKIIDVRRNPMDCCFANYFRYYGSAADYSFSQTGMGRYYADYVEAMRHFDAVLPGRVHRLIHDDLVENFEHEVRRLLDYVGVSFEGTCLRFYETQRPVHTPSSEQVRRPINRSGFGRWRNYEPWLSPLRDALGEAATNWRS